MVIEQGNTEMTRLILPLSSFPQTFTTTFDGTENPCAATGLLRPGTGARQLHALPREYLGRVEYHDASVSHPEIL
jgi:hypothetical protein